MRTTLAGAFAATALLASSLATAPASAEPGVLEATCTMRYGVTTGPGGGDADCAVTGVVGGTPVAGGGVMLFDMHTACPSGTATGTLTGAGVTIDFTWTRVGPAAIWTTTGDVNGFGPVVFSAPCPTSGEVGVFTLVGV